MMSNLAQLPAFTDTPAEADVSELTERLIAAIVAAGGGRYVGLLPAIPGTMETLVLFASQQTRTTLSLPLSRLSVRVVRARVSRSDQLFARCAAECRTRAPQAA